MPKAARAAIAVIFPIFLLTAVETGHYQSLFKTFSFAANNVGVVIFDIFIISALFATLSLAVRRLWISGAVCSVVFYAFSAIEYYKYNISGSHFIISDLALTKNVTDVAVFADLKFNFPLFVIAVLLVLYVGAMWLFDIKVELERPVRYAASLGVFVMMSVMAITPYFSTVCAASGVNSEYTKNTFQENERFAKNSLTANLAVNFNQLFTARPTRPQDYNEEAVDAIISASDTVDGIRSNGNINVITVMSESFADFRDFLSVYSDTATIPEGTYDVWDELLEKGHRGTCVVPTFGGGTVKSEFELIFGLPMEAQGNPSVPLSLFDKGEEYASVPSLYRNNGYATTYMHPFSADFYERSDYYGGFGFDTLIFEDEMSVYLSDELLRMERSEGIQTAGYYHNFISDESVFNDAINRIKYTEEVDYIHITTMQNHMPYGNGAEEEKNYFAGIRNSTEALRDFIAQLEELDEPVILLYVGDHYPFFSDSQNVYNRLGIDAGNCDLLYEQKYFIWTNTDIEFEDENLISMFYLPCIIANKAGVSDSFTEAILSQKEDCPIYSPVVASEGTDVLNILTYDRISGNGFSDKKK